MRGEGFYKTLAQKFWSKVNKKGPMMPHMKTRCWVWTGMTCMYGYGSLVHLGKRVKAHRVAWFLQYGKYPEPCGLHACDNTVCVRTSHLREGTQVENMEDMNTRDRHAKGVGSGVTILTDEKVLQIRKLYKTGNKQYALAAMFHVSQTAISCIVTKKRWSHV